MRRHGLAAAPARDRPRLDGPDAVEAALEIGAGPRPATEARIERLVLPVSGMIVTAGRVSLPRFDQHVPGDATGRVEDSSFDGDALSGNAGSRDVAAKVVPEDI